MENEPAQYVSASNNAGIHHDKDSDTLLDSGHSTYHQQHQPHNPFPMGIATDPPLVNGAPLDYQVLAMAMLQVQQQQQQEAKLRSIANNSAGSSGTELRLPSIPNFIRGGIQPEPFGNDGKMNIHPELDFTWYDVMQLFRNASYHDIPKGVEHSGPARFKVNIEKLCRNNMIPIHLRKKGLHKCTLVMCARELCMASLLKWVEESIFEPLESWDFVHKYEHPNTHLSPLKESRKRRTTSMGLTGSLGSSGETSQKAKGSSSQSLTPHHSDLMNLMNTAIDSSLSPTGNVLTNNNDDNSNNNSSTNNNNNSDYNSNESHSGNNNNDNNSSDDNGVDENNNSGVNIAESGGQKKRKYDKVTQRQWEVNSREDKDGCVWWEMRPKGHKYYTWMSVSNILHSPDKDNLWRSVEEFELQKCMQQKKHEKDKTYREKGDSKDVPIFDNAAHEGATLVPPEEMHHQLRHPQVVSVPVGLETHHSLPHSHTHPIHQHMHHIPHHPILPHEHSTHSHAHAHTHDHNNLQHQHAHQHTHHQHEHTHNAHNNHPEDTLDLNLDQHV